METPLKAKSYLFLLILLLCSCTEPTVSFPELKHDSWTFGTTLSSINTTATGDTLLLGSADNGSIYFFIPDSLIRAVKVAEGGDKIYKIESLGHTDRQKMQLLVSVRNKGIRLVEIRTDLLEAQVIKTFLCDTTNISPKKLNRYSAYDWIYSPKDKARYIATSNGLWKITEEMLSDKSPGDVAMELSSDRDAIQGMPEYPIRSITLNPDCDGSLYYTARDGFYHLDINQNNHTRLYKGNYFYSTIDNHDTLYVLGKNSMLKGKADNHSAMQLSDNEGMAKLLFWSEDPCYEYRIFEKSKAIVDGERCIIPASLQDKNSFLKTRTGYYFVSYDKLIKVYPHQNISSTRKTIMAACRKNDNEIFILDNQYNLYMLGMNDRIAHRLGQLSRHQRVRMMAYAHEQLYFLTESGLQVCSPPKKTIFLVNSTIQLTDWKHKAILDDDEVTAMKVFKTDSLLLGTRNHLWYISRTQEPEEIKLRWNGQLLDDINETGYISTIDASAQGYKVGVLNFGLFEGRNSIKSEISNRPDVESPTNILSVSSCNNTWAISSGDHVYIYNYRSNTVERKYSIPAYAQKLAVLENDGGCNLYLLPPKGIAWYTLKANSYQPHLPYFSDIPFHPHSSFKMNNDFYVCSSDIGVCLIENGVPPVWVTNYDEGTVLSATEWLSVAGAFALFVIFIVLAIRYKRQIEKTHKQKDEITVRLKKQIDDLNKKREEKEKELNEQKKKAEESQRIIEERKKEEEAEKRKKYEIEVARKQEKASYIKSLESRLTVYHYLKFDKFKEIPEDEETKYTFLNEHEQEIDESIRAGITALNTQRMWMRKAVEGWCHIIEAHQLNCNTSNLQELREKTDRYFSSDIDEERLKTDAAGYENEKNEVHTLFKAVRKNVYKGLAEKTTNALKPENLEEVSTLRQIIIDIHNKVFFNEAVETECPNNKKYEKVAFICMSGVSPKLTPQQILALSYYPEEESKERKLVNNANVSDYKDKGDNKRLSRILSGINRRPAKKEILSLWDELFFRERDSNNVN